MITIGRMPAVVSSFFRPARKNFSKPAWPHFWGLVTAIALATEHTVERLNALLRLHTHRTNDGDGTFTFNGEFDAPTAASCALLFDFDNDRDLDIVLIDELDDVIILMKNSGTNQIPAVTAWGTLCIALGLLILGTLVRCRPRTA
jgi:hypothetical protein